MDAISKKNKHKFFIGQSCLKIADDIVVAFDGIEVLNDKQYFAAQRAADNSVFTIIVWRDQKYHELEVTHKHRRLGSYIEFYHELY